jgi:hypothetical protein
MGHLRAVKDPLRTALAARQGDASFPTLPTAVAEVVTEAVAVSVPVVSSRIAGSVGLLGADYPGFFPFADTAALAGLLRRAETDAPFYADLKRPPCGR